MDLVLIPIWILKDDAELVLSFAPVLYFGSNFLLKISIDSWIVSFESKFNSLQIMTWKHLFKHVQKLKENN